jgi:hypothetical protein
MEKAEGGSLTLFVVPCLAVQSRTGLQCSLIRLEEIATFKAEWYQYNIFQGTRNVDEIIFKISNFFDSRDA